MKNPFDTNHPFFTPLWRRLAIVAFCLAWAVLEYSYGERIWMTVSLAIAAWLGWAFFLAFQPREEE
jgi:hypothetical protein